MTSNTNTPAVAEQEALSAPILAAETDEQGLRDQYAHVLERVAIYGDLSRMHPADRVRYYAELCRSLELNPLTRPFEFTNLDGKLVLYAKRDATDQLRAKRRLSITSLESRMLEPADQELLAVTARGRLPDGREDEATGIVALKGLTGQTRANAIMKAETKAKRRLTLSLAGLGFLSEDEVLDTPGARKVEVDPETGAITTVEDAGEADGRTVTDRLAEAVAAQKEARLGAVTTEGEVVEGEVVEETPAPEEAPTAQDEPEPAPEPEPTDPSSDEPEAPSAPEGRVVDAAATVRPTLAEGVAAAEAAAEAAPEVEPAPPATEEVGPDSPPPAIVGTLEADGTKLLGYDRRERPDKVVQTFFLLRLPDGGAYAVRAIGEVAEGMFAKHGRGYRRAIEVGSTVSVVGELVEAISGLYKGQTVLEAATVEVLAPPAPPAAAPAE